MTERRPRRRKLFAGIELDEEARRACSSAVDALQRAGFAARYEAPEKLHITMAFLGYVEPERLPEIEAVLRETASPFSRFTIELDKIGAFPHERRPRVVFVGARSQGAAFRELSSALRTNYCELGFSFRNDAVAHVTIARVKDSRRPLPAVEVVPVALEVTRLALFESTPDEDANTSRYEVIAVAALV